MAIGCWLLVGASCNRGEDQDAPARAPRSASPGASVAPAAAASVKAPPSAQPPGDHLGAAASTRYPPGRLHSPLVASHITEWKKMWEGHPGLSPNRFIKVGDSVTASGDNLYCVARTPNLSALEKDHPQLFEAATYFGAAGKYGGSFGRESEAAVVGWSAWNAIDGTKNHVWREQQTYKARVALVQFGTNDIEIHALHHFADKLFDLAELLESNGALPVLYTIMHRADRASAGRDVPRYNAVIRGVAQALQVPLVDYHLGLETLPRRGLSGDGIHPSTFSGGAGRNPCDMTPEGLRSGYNLRNWLTLQVLDRLRRVMAGSFKAEPALSAAGFGDDGAPIQIVAPEPNAPWVDFQSLERSLPISTCSDSPGLGVSYRLELTRAGRFRVLGFDRGLESDVHVYADGAGSPAGGACLGRDARQLVLKLGPGSYRVELRRKPPPSKPPKQPASGAAPAHPGALLVLLQES